jgi:hypothetical protein
MALECQDQRQSRIYSPYMLARHSARNHFQALLIEGSVTGIGMCDTY